MTETDIKIVGRVVGEQIRKLRDATADMIVEQILEREKPLLARIAELEAKALHFDGQWVPKDYPAGSLVQRSATVWHSSDGATAEDQPGSSEAWRQLVRPHRSRHSA